MANFSADIPVRAEAANSVAIYLDALGGALEGGQRRAGNRTRNGVKGGEVVCGSWVAEVYFDDIFGVFRVSHIAQPRCLTLLNLYRFLCTKCNRVGGYTCRTQTYYYFGTYINHYCYVSRKWPKYNSIVPKRVPITYPPVRGKLEVWKNLKKIIIIF